MKILGKYFRASSGNRTHNLPVTSQDALTTKLWVTRGEQVTGLSYGSQDFTSREYMNTGH